MGNYKHRLQEELDVGDFVIAFTFRSCAECNSWFRFRYDKAAEAINKYGYYKVACPICDREYVYERVEHLPNLHMKFNEVD